MRDEPTIFDGLRLFAVYLLLALATLIVPDDCYEGRRCLDELEDMEKRLRDTRT